MKNKMFYLIVALMLTQQIIVSSQTFLQEGVVLKGIEIDSIFEVFIAPNIPEAWKDELECESSFKIACEVLIDTNGKVISFDKYPLVKQSILDTSVSMQYVLKSLDSVATLWKFKPILHRIDHNYSQEEIVYYNKRNLDKRKRPFGGKQHHIFVIDFCSQYIHSYGVTMFYWLNAKQNK